MLSQHQTDDVEAVLHDFFVFFGRISRHQGTINTPRKQSITFTLFFPWHFWPSATPIGTGCSVEASQTTVRAVDNNGFSAESWKREGLNFKLNLTELLTKLQVLDLFVYKGNFISKPNTIPNKPPKKIRKHTRKFNVLLLS